MSGQYPSGYNSQHGAHRNQFNAQPSSQMMNTGQLGSGGIIGQNALVGNTVGGQGAPSGSMMPMGGYHTQQQVSGNMGVGVVSGLHSSGTSVQQQHSQMVPVNAPANAALMGVVGPNIIGPGSNTLMPQQQIIAGIAVSQAQQQGQHQQHVQPGPSSLPQVPQNIQTASAGNNMLAISQPNPHKEINIVALSRLGQETVQDITSRFQEIFTALKIIQPTANRDNNTEKKVQEYFRTIRLLFKRVRIIYEKCNDGYPQGMEYTHVESLIPYKEEPDHRIEPPQCDEYRKALQENQELIDTVKLKNRQLREIIDRTRIIIWEINTMLAMRRS